MTLLKANWTHGSMAMASAEDFSGLSAELKAGEPTMLFLEACWLAWR